MVLPRSALLQRAQNSCVTRGESLTIFTSDGWVWCRMDPLGGGVLRKPAHQRTSIQPSAVFVLGRCTADRWASLPQCHSRHATWDLLHGTMILKR